MCAGHVQLISMRWTEDFQWTKMEVGLSKVIVVAWKACLVALEIRKKLQKKLFCHCLLIYHAVSNL